MSTPFDGKAVRSNQPRMFRGHRSIDGMQLANSRVFREVLRFHDHSFG